MAHPTFTMTGLSTRRRYSWDMAAIAPAPVRPGSGDQPTEMLRDRHAHWEYLGFWVLEILCEPSALPKSKLSQSRRQRSHPRSWGANGSHFRGVFNSSHQKMDTFKVAIESHQKNGNESTWPISAPPNLRPIGVRPQLRPPLYYWQPGKKLPGARSSGCPEITWF